MHTRKRNTFWKSLRHTIECIYFCKTDVVYQYFSFLPHTQFPIRYPNYALPSGKPHSCVYAQVYVCAHVKACVYVCMHNYIPLKHSQAQYVCSRNKTSMWLLAVTLHQHSISSHICDGLFDKSSLVTSLDNDGAKQLVHLQFNDNSIFWCTITLLNSLHWCNH
jgi:hypothetical protein